MSVVPFSDGKDGTMPVLLPDKSEYYSDAQAFPQDHGIAMKAMGSAPGAQTIQMEDPEEEQENEQLREINTMNAFFNPARLKDQMIQWYPNDNFGIGRAEAVADQSAGFQATTEHAWLNAKGKVEEDAYVPPGE